MHQFNNNQSPDGVAPDLSKKKGSFIVFDGIDFAGKTTQLSLLAKYLENCIPKEKIVLLHDPGSTELSKTIRKIILIDQQEYECPVDKFTELFLFLASRRQLVVEKIRPALKKGCIVLCDRYFHSTLVYQGHIRGIPLSYIRDLNNQIIEECVPDLTFIFHLSAEESLKRMELNHNKEKYFYETKGKEFLQKIADGYQKISKEESDRLHSIQATLSHEQIHQEIVHTMIEKGILVSK